MKICFDAHFYTDGDFSFREDVLNMLFHTDSPLYKEAKIKYSYKHEDGYIDINFLAEGNKNACRWALRDLLEGLMCSIDTHKHWLVKGLYNVLEYFYEDIWGDLNQEKEKCLYGNYEFSKITLKMEK